MCGKLPHSDQGVSRSVFNVIATQCEVSIPGCYESFVEAPEVGEAHVLQTAISALAPEHALNDNRFTIHQDIVYGVLATDFAVKAIEFGNLIFTHKARIRACVHGIICEHIDNPVDVTAVDSRIVF